MKEKINSQPDYQRGDVWNPKKKSLLIDSMLRGIDIPKIYLRKLENEAYLYEVADGQQRLNTIFGFIDNTVRLPDFKDKGLNLSVINGYKVGGKTYNQDLPESLKQLYDNYPITIAIVENATPDEIRTLFGRLQEGISLVPAEKRNAIISKIGKHIDNFSLNHLFFDNSKINPSRFKRQDYFSHVIALIAYNNSDDLKANLILKLYYDKNFKLSTVLQKKISVVLDHMKEIDEISRNRIYKKFNFIDLFWLLFSEFDNYETINYKSFAKEYDIIEKERINNQADPKALINKEETSTKDKELYDYVLAFKYGGSLTENIKIRKNYLSKRLITYLSK
ncbi:MAG: DUF262 domain-containing protein [Bacteroidales bacterium]|nr:DUF262 domain-containing protein [Bacteroidales bacterium]